MRQEARAVVIGSGIAGSSVAYHLTLLGWKEVVVLEQGEQVSGTTSHAPGLVGQLRSSKSHTRLLMQSVALYRTLQVDGQRGFDEVGSLRLATTSDRFEEIERQASFARGIGLAAELIGPAEVARLCPILDTRDVVGALYLASDGSARAPILARALAEGARSRGAEIHPRTPVTGFEVENGRVRAVRTTKGRIGAEVVVAAAGIWSRHLARLLGISLPLIPLEHQYAASGPIKELRPDRPIPNVRDPDQLIYFRQDGDRLVMGGYEGNPGVPSGELNPQGDNPTVRPFDPRRFQVLRDSAAARVPALAGAGWTKEVCGLENFTPDGEFILGEAPEARGLWFASGFCAHGVSGSGGIGKALAEWIVSGHPPIDLWHMDLRRFGPHARARRYLARRAAEVYASYYHLSYPGKEKQSARELRLSPIYPRLKELGAVFGEKAGWERPNWFAPNEKLPEARGLVSPRGTARWVWSRAIGAEHQATRERVALFDETSFSKFEVSGRGAAAFLDRLAANEVDRPPGTVTYTQLLNPRGGIECDLTINRLERDRFLIITGTAFGYHDLSWIRSQMPGDGSVEARDVTSSLACIGVWGPRARDLMSAASESDFSGAAFPYLTSREVKVGEVPALAVRVTYVGELGWELYAPMEFGLKLWDILWEAGKPLGVAAAGYRAIDSLRLEKAYRYWSAEIDSDYNPLEAGLGFAVKLKKPAFLGRDALLEIKARGLRRKLCCLTIDDPAAVPVGGEPILDGGRVLGTVTSGGYGYTVKKAIAYGYLPIEDAVEGKRLAIDICGKPAPAVVSREPIYDPKGEKIKA